MGLSAAPPGARISEAGAIEGEGLIPADEDGLAQPGLEARPRGQGLRRDDERRDLGQRPARARRLVGRGRPRRARSETSPRSPARPTRSTPGCWPSSAGETWSRRSGSPRSRTARSASAFAAALTWSSCGPRHRNRIFGLLTQFGLRISLHPASPARRDGAARAPRRSRGLARLDRRAPRPDRRARAADQPDRPQSFGPIARSDPRAKLLQTIPGVGPLISLTFAAEIGDVSRFSLGRRSSSAMPAWRRGSASRASARRPGGCRRPARDASLGGGRGRQPGLAADQPLPRALPPPRRPPRHQPGEVVGRPQAADLLPGTCSRAARSFNRPAQRLPRQAPRAFWPPDGPAWN